MNHKAVSTTFMGCSLALALSAFACGGNNNGNDQYGADAKRTGQPPPAGAIAGTSGSTAASEQNRSPVTLTGCLQKGDGRSDYILTEVNSTRTAVGTSGSAGSSTSEGATKPDAVGQEQMRAASHAYHLHGDRDNLEPLVGKQVRVSGTMTQKSDLNAHDESGKMKDRDRSKIDEDDLAQVDVASVDSVADNCGGAKRRK
jgi:hypothetical protein